MYRHKPHAHYEQENPHKHSKLAPTLIGDRTKHRGKHPDERTCRDNKRYNRDIHAKSACKNSQEWVNHAMHRIQDHTKQHEDKKLETKAHERSSPADKDWKGSCWQEYHKSRSVFCTSDDVRAGRRSHRRLKTRLTHEL